jgi:hypothetical protein
MSRCDFHDAHDVEGQPTGQRCTKQATHLIKWHDSKQFSLACEPHAQPEAILRVASAYTVSAITDI